MMRIFYNYLFLIVCSLAGYVSVAQTAAQSVIAPAGGSSKNIQGYTIDFTVGESVVETAGSNPIFTQGLHQSLSVKDFPEALLNLQAFVKEKYIELRWSTLTETDNAWFYIEHSTDGINFTVIDSVRTNAINGNSNVPLNYNYTDLQPAQGANYYRIKQVSNIGSTRYSGTVVVNFIINDWFVQVYPNPVINTLHAKLYADKKTTVTYFIYTITGQRVYTRSVNYEKGYHDETFVFNGYRPGVYILSIRENSTNRSLRIKVLKQ
jgi:hypothetical protein